MLNFVFGGGFFKVGLKDVRVLLDELDIFLRVYYFFIVFRSEGSYDLCGIVTCTNLFAI